MKENDEPSQAAETGTDVCLRCVQNSKQRENVPKRLQTVFFPFALSSLWMSANTHKQVCGGRFSENKHGRWSKAYRLNQRTWFTQKSWNLKVQRKCTWFCFVLPNMNIWRWCGGSKADQDLMRHTVCSASAFSSVWAQGIRPMTFGVVSTLLDQTNPYKFDQIVFVGHNYTIQLKSAFCHFKRICLRTQANKIHYCIS